MSDITTFSLYELKEDRAASIMDRDVCRKLAEVSDEPQKSLLTWRADTDQRIIDVIDAELARRGESNE